MREALTILLPFVCAMLWGWCLGGWYPWRARGLLLAVLGGLGFALVAQALLHW